MADISVSELFKVLYQMTTLPGRMPKRHDSTKYSLEELQEAVATLATCVNRLTALLENLINETAKKFAKTDREFPLSAD
jgi:hypothetical protein